MKPSILSAFSILTLIIDELRVLMFPTDILRGSVVPPPEALMVVTPARLLETSPFRVEQFMVEQFSESLIMSPDDCKALTIT